jgi:uncharacterized protein YukE
MKYTIKIKKLNQSIKRLNDYIKNLATELEEKTKPEILLKGIRRRHAKQHQ